MKIYCSGIGGIGLSAYAALQREMGHEVLGSDRTATDLTQELEASGITVFLNQDGSAVPDDVDLFVYSEAIPPSAPERLRASELGLTQMSYPEALAKLSEPYTVIAVCGTHGKSSTTAMAARLLLETGRDPTVVVGTKVQELGGRNWRRGNSSLFLIEACEYRKSFHFYHPQIVLMTNCDGDHFDYYKSPELYREAYKDFLRMMPASGTVITHMSDPDCAEVSSAAECTVLDGDTFPLIDMQTPGRHMQQNAQLVLGLATLMDIPQEEAVEVLQPFAGTWRRMELKGTHGDDVLIVDDYAHHPREIRATIAALRGRYPKRRLICVFQPHTHNRTLSLFEDFATAFANVDQLIISDVYDARHDTESATVDPDAFASAIAVGSEVKAEHGGSLEDIRKKLASILKDGDLALFMGAGDITQLAADMVTNPAPGFASTLSGDKGTEV